MSWPIAPALRSETPRRGRGWPVVRIGIYLIILGCLVVSMKMQHYRPLTTGGDAITYDGPLELISHAGVGLPQARYSNSIEALDAAVTRGFTKIELDFEETRDGKIVAAHDWHQTYLELHDQLSIFPPSLAILLRPRVPTHAEFMREPIRRNLRPIDIAVLKAWLSRNPSARIVTDAKGGNLKTLGRLLDAGIPARQIIPQIYSRDELPAVRRLGFEDVIYTLYRDTSVSAADAINFATIADVSVTMHAGRASKKDLNAFEKAGVPIYIHTINDLDQAELLRSWGATGIYTDYLFRPPGGAPEQP